MRNINSSTVLLRPLLFLCSKISPKQRSKRKHNAFWGNLICAFIFCKSSHLCWTKLQVYPKFITTAVPTRYLSAYSTYGSCTYLDPTFLNVTCILLACSMLQPPLKWQLTWNLPTIDFSMTCKPVSDLKSLNAALLSYFKTITKLSIKIVLQHQSLHNSASFVLFSPLSLRGRGFSRESRISLL